MNDAPSVQQLGPNFTRVTHNGMTVWYSYATAVAFQRSDDLRPTVRKNDWGPTTGKHLNKIDHRQPGSRVSEDEFIRLMAGQPEAKPPVPVQVRSRGRRFVTWKE